MKKLIPILIILFVNKILISQNWDNTTFNNVSGTSGSFYTSDISTDVNGNKLVVGSYEGSFAGKASSGSDGFFAKFDINNNLTLLIILEGIEYDTIKSVSTDGYGNSYINGVTYFSFNQTFLQKVFPIAGPSYFMNNINLLNGTNSSNAIFAKFSTNGNIHWFHELNFDKIINLGNNDREYNSFSNGYDVNITENTNGTTTPLIIFTGVFKHINAKFNQGLPLKPPPSCNSSLNSINSSSLNNINGFMACYNSCGELIWSKIIENNNMNSFSEITGVVCSKTNDNTAFICGSYKGSVTFKGSSNITLTTPNNSSHYGFIGRINLSNGDIQWVDDIVGSKIKVNSISLLNKSNYPEPVIIGDFIDNNISFNNNISGTSSSSSREVFVSKYSYNGLCQWVNIFGGSLNDKGNSIACNQNNSNDIFVTGDFLGDFNFSNKTYGNNINNSITNQNQFYFAKLDGSGNELWADEMIGDYYQGVYSSGSSVYLGQSDIPITCGNFIKNSSLDYLHPSQILLSLPNNISQRGFYLEHYPEICTTIPYNNFNVIRAPGSPSALVTFTPLNIGSYLIFYREKNTINYPDNKCYDPTPWNIQPNFVPILSPQTITISGLNNFSLYEWGILFLNPCSSYNNTMPISTTFINNTVNAFTVNNNSISINQNFKLYPNPANEILNIQLNSNDFKINKIEFLDLNGKLIKTISNIEQNNSMITLNTNDLVSSLYFIKIFNNNGVENHLINISK